MTDPLCYCVICNFFIGRFESFREKADRSDQLPTASYTEVEVMCTLCHVVCVLLQVTFTESLKNHPFFALSCFILIMLFVAGIHKRVVAPSMYLFYVLQDYNMSCDDVRPVGARSYLMHMRRTQRNCRFVWPAPSLLRDTTP
ncbi:hypothetical protein NP493_441g02016 [Ridgeia piscesae]|uniref:Transmembrane protein 188 n=1 Tax=Ridgeia piscesae TaxID=27915 RepID=A0AAD9KZD0_RIDPI|nr:hypothetical protein NP493_441g02016 [Ridgeia piscesae]